MIRSLLQHIGQNYIDARKLEDFSGHPLASYLRHEAIAHLHDAMGAKLDGLILKGSAGKGNWAEVPWLVIMDPTVTASATQGYYIVYLFSADMREVFLSLNQGTTDVRREFIQETTQVLKDRAALIRARVPEFSSDFSATPISLQSVRSLPKDYEASHAFGQTYHINNLPTEETLCSELERMLQLYRRLTFRGGLEPSLEESTSDTPIIEQRRYRLHRKIERNPTASKSVKAKQGYICKACGFNFESTYGNIGKEFIEAHHLLPLSELPEDKPISYDPLKDFVVLCANCHRMIHRANPPMAFQDFVQLIRKHDLSPHS